MIKLTLGTDSEARKRVQLVAAFLRYIPAAAVRFALHSKAGNDKHNPGEPIHHARGKSSDHEECIMRHLVDMQDIRAFMERNKSAGREWLPGDEIVQMLLSEATAEFWRAGIFLQELCEQYEGAPLAPGARLPAPSVPEGTDGWPGLLNPEGEKTFDDFMQEFTAPSDPAKLPRIVDGAPWGEAWAIVDCNGAFMGHHSSYADAESCLREILAAPPVNTPEELAELEKMAGKVVLVAGPGVVDGGHVEHGFPLIEDAPDMRGNEIFGPAGADWRAHDETLARCGHMSSTKRVCTLVAQHDERAHSDGAVLWSD